MDAFKIKRLFVRVLYIYIGVFIGLFGTVSEDSPLVNLTMLLIPYQNKFGMVRFSTFRFWFGNFGITLYGYVLSTKLRVENYNL